MNKISIITDSNSGITQSEGERLGVRVLPMPFYINGELYYEDISLSQAQFYERLDDDADISTSQPSPGSVTDLWDEVLRTSDEIIHIPMSSGLSSSCESAEMLARDYNGRVHVVDNQRISITQRQSVLDALEMANAGLSADKIVEILMREKLESSIYITVDTLKYLKKGGRVTAAGAAIGTVLGIKPVLQIQGEKLDAFSKVRGMKTAKNVMLDAIASDLEKRFAGHEVHMAAAHTCSQDEAEAWREQIKARFPGYDIHMDPLSLSVSCHIGRGAVAIAVSRKVEF